MDELLKHVQLNNGCFSSYSLNEQCKANQFSRHFHDSAEILFMFDVQGEYVVESRKYQLAPFSIFFIKPSKYHYMILKDDTQYSRCVFNVSADYLPNDLVTRAFSKGEFFHVGAASQITKNFQRIIEYRQTLDERDYKVVERALLAEIMMLVCMTDEEHNRDEFKYLDEFNSRVIKYIRENLTSITSLEQMASDLYVSKSTLYHSFKKAMKISIMQYVRNKKVMYAHNLIQNGVRPTKAYVLSGFEDYTTFYRSYKMFFGRSPGSSDNDVSENPPSGL